MKFLMALLFLCASLQIAAQQDHFLDLPKHGKLMTAPVFPSTLAEVFAEPDAWTSLTIYPDELQYSEQYDFSKLVNLKLVQIKFSFCPDSSDAAKLFFQDSINRLLKHMTAFSKCPKLEKVVFGVGEQIYLNQEQLKSVDQYNGRTRQLLFDENVREAWTSFGKDVSLLLPDVKLYAFTWGW